MNAKKNGMISIIIPVYNVAAFVEKCVDSVLAQTYENIEVILVDDGSTDGSEIICDKYGTIDKRVKVIHKKNGGQGAARNVGLDAATGEYIGFVDSDDWVKKDMFENMLTALLETDSDLSVCGVIYDHIFVKKKYEFFQKPKVFVADKVMEEYLGTPHIGCALWNKLYRRELWENIRIPEVRAREDIMVLYSVVGRCKKIVHIGSCEYVQLVRPGSTEQKFSRDKLEVITAHEIANKYIQEEFPDLYRLVELNIAKECVDLIEEILSLGEKQYERELEYLRNRLSIELRAHEAHASENDMAYDKLIDLSKNERLFLMNARKRRVKTKIENSIKKACLLVIR